MVTSGGISTQSSTTLSGEGLLVLPLRTDTLGPKIVSAFLKFELVQVWCTSSMICLPGLNGTIILSLRETFHVSFYRLQSTVAEKLIIVVSQTIEKVFCEKL